MAGYFCLATIFLCTWSICRSIRWKLYLKMDEFPIYKTVQDSNKEPFVDLSLQNERSFANQPRHGFRISIPQESIGRTNLDRVLENLFRKKIEFHVDTSFILCLHTALEKYVKTLFVELMKLQKVQRKLNKLHWLCSDIGYVTSRCNDVLRVLGSFYEGTKNTFPDEFDYILVLLTARSERGLFKLPYSKLFEIALLFHQHVKDLIESTSILIIENFLNDLFFLEFTSLEMAGPACKLCFILKQKIPSSIFKGDSVKIHVDITPAIKVIDSFLPSNFEQICSVERFRDEKVKIGSFIMTQKDKMIKENTDFAFTETEVSFMKNCLSTRHKRTYRLLKYLINGEMEEEDQLREMCLDFEISSYVLKTLMIKHHYICQNNENLTESHCVIDVLKTVQSCIYIQLLQSDVEKTDKL